MEQTVKTSFAEQHYRVLGHEEGRDWTEIITLPEAKSEFVNTAEDYVRVIHDLRSVGKNIYVGINPRTDPSKPEAKDIKKVTCIVIDIDPVRPKDAPSTEEQWKASIEHGKKLSQDFRGSVVVSSGSGCHVYIPIEPIKVENWEGLTESLAKWTKLVKEKYATKEFKIDSIFDLPRVIRAWGSFNNRSKRPCEPLEGMDRFERAKYAFPQAAPVQKPKVPVPQAEERLLKLAASNKYIKDIIEGSTSQTSPSEYDFEFVMTLGKAHFSEAEIEAVWHYNKHGNKSPKKGDIKRILERKLNLKTETKSKTHSLIHNSGSYYESLKNRRMGIRTGINKYDDMVSGLKAQKLYIIAARPNTGKTTLITQLLDNVASQGTPCLFFPTEVGPEPIFDKIVSRRAGISLRKFQNGTFTEDDLKKIEEIKPTIQNIPLVVFEDFGLSIDKVEEGIKAHAPSVVAIDYFQAMRWEDPDSVGEKSDAVRKLKEIAGDYNLPIILASQLNRNDGKPDLRDLKGTGALEEFGDVISFMYRASGPTVYPVLVDWLVMKSKYSETGNIDLKFESTYCRFSENEAPPIKPENR